MAKELKIDLLADTRDFQRGVQDAEKELAQVSDALDDVARDGDSTARKLERSFDDVSDAARESGDEASSRLERSFKDIADSARKSGDDAGDGLKKGIDKGSDAAGEFADEAKSSAKESAASFSGEFEDVGDLIQEVAANAFAGFGPLGAAAGIAAAVGIGAITAALAAGGEQSDEMKQKIADLGAEFIETGGIGERSMEGAIDALKEMATTTEEGETSLAALRKLARESGSDFEDLAAAFIGSGEDATKAYEEALETLTELQDAAANAPQEDPEKFRELSRQRDAQQEIVNLLEKTKDKTEAAAEADRAYAAAGGPELEAKAALIEQVNEAYDEAADSASEFINEESGIFDVSAFITSMQEREQAIRDYQTTLASTPLSADAKAYLNSQGVESAASFLTGYKNATPAQQAELNRIWSESGKQNSGSYAGALQDGMPDSITGPTVEPVIPDLTGVRNKFQYFFNQNPVQVPFAPQPRGNPVT